MRNIVLVGFMGTGKNACGRRIAKRLKLRYVSTDDIIEQKENLIIPEIFAKKGEPYFRKVEKEVVEEISLMKDCVIAAGGGVVLAEQNMKNLREDGIIICLKATPEEILQRTKNFSHRPLLNVSSPIDTIRSLLEKRRPFYEKADHTIDTSGKGLDRVVDEILAIVRGKE